MRYLLRSFAVVSVLAATATSVQLAPFVHKPAQQHNKPAMAEAQLPNPNISTQGGSIIISDILGSQRSISTFASFTRDVSSIASRLESQSTNTTLLAPLNSAISALPRKPWEDQQDYARLGEQAYLGDGGSARAAQNLERFVNAHVVPTSPWAEEEKATTLAGREIWWEIHDGISYIMPDKIEVEKVGKQVGNGEVWIIKGVVNYTG